MVVTASEIKTQIIAGTYPEGTISSDNVFDYQQYEKRRKYPSCEITINNPTSTSETKKDTSTTYGFEIKLFTKNLGIQSNEVNIQDTLETTIMAQIESMSLQNHKLVFESKIWKRETVQREGTHPAFLVSTLIVQVRQITSSVLTLDGVLTLLEMDGAPLTPTTFDCFDTTIDEGYKHIEEQVTLNVDGALTGIDFAGAFSGIFMTNIVVKSADIGATSVKLNNLTKLKSNGFLPLYKISYTDKTNTSTPSAISDIVYVNFTSLRRIYSHNDNTVYRLTGDVTQPSIIT